MAMDPDSSDFPRAEMVGKLARWANSHQEIWKSRPVKNVLSRIVYRIPGGG